MNKRQSRRIIDGTSQTKIALHERVRQMLTLERLCSRFPLVARQLESRHGGRDTFHVKDEYDVRDLLHALLTLEYDDIWLEEWTPPYAGGNPQTDFLLKLEQIVLEAKMIRSDWGAGELEEQLTLDIKKYNQRPDCRTLVCFVYDPEERIANPHEIENHLGRDRDGLAVRIIIASRP